MNEESNIFTQLKSLSGQQNQQGWPYSIPANYFASFTEKLLSRVADDNNLPSVLSNISKSMPYAVPEGYFSDEREAGEIISNLSKDPVYQVDSGYFEGFYGRLSERLAKRPVLVRITQHFGGRVAAAIVIGMVALASLFYFLQEKSDKQNSSATNFAQQKIVVMPTEQLAGFLNLTDSTFAVNKTASAISPAGSSIDLNQVLKNFSEKDLKKFLEETYTEDDEFLLN